MSNVNDPISRRRALALGGSIAGGLAIASAPLLGAPGRALAAPTHGGIDVTGQTKNGQLPMQQIEAIMQTTGMMMNGVLSINLDRDDLHVTGPGGLLWKPAFEVNHMFSFQPLGDGRAILNAEMAMISSETNVVIDKIFAGGLTFMAFHQHFFNESPQIWHMHFRGIGDPLALARAAIAVVRATGTPLPQSMPNNPTTPLPKNQLARILGGTAQVGSAGVVTVSVPRADTIVLAGVVMKPDAGVSITVEFEPLGNGQVACAPDYALLATEVNPALGVARAQGFTVHCLYNQETDEQPQLYFSHHLAVGAPIDLAHRVSKVLDTMNVMRSS